MHQVHVLSHADALRVLTTIQQQLEKENKGAAIAVVDAQGELMAFLRTDDCRLASITIAMNKAFTAARERQESKSVGQSALDNQWPLTNYGDMRYLGWGGGVPLVYEGKIVGGVGVSGLPEAEDMVLARMGAAAL